MKKIFYLTLFFLALSIPAFAEKITVAAAANVQFALKEISTIYTKETGIEIEPVIGASGILANQIKNAAPFDIFLSADTRYPKALFEDKLAAAQPQIYAYGALVVWSTTMKTITTNLQALTGASITRIALAEPKIAPYGAAAVEAMTYYKIYDKILPKLIYGESISQANQFISTGAAGIGFTSKSTVLAPEMTGKGVWAEIPHNAYSPIAQSVVLLKYGTINHPIAAKQFYDFILSIKAKKIWEKYGYIVK